MAKKKLSFELFVLQLFGYSVTLLSAERRLCYIVTKVRIPLYRKNIFSMKNSTWRDCTIRGYQKLIRILLHFNFNDDGNFSAKWYYFNSAKCMYIDDWWMQIKLVQNIKKSISENRFLSYNAYEASFHVNSFTLPQINNVISQQLSFFLQSLFNAIHIHGVFIWEM